MPNVSWQEPQILVDLLALSLYADQNKMDLPGAREIAVISPWLSDIEMSLRPSTWHQQLNLGAREQRTTFLDCMRAFLKAGWRVRVAVLAYGPKKRRDSFHRERRLLRRLMRAGAEVTLVSKLHAKGVVAPLGIVTGSTNVTMSGFYEQAQNARYLAYEDDEYVTDRAVLMGRFEGFAPAELDDLGGPGAPALTEPLPVKVEPFPAAFVELLATSGELALAEAVWALPDLARPDFVMETDFEAATELSPAMVWPTERVGVVVEAAGESVQVVVQGGWRVVRVPESLAIADPSACALRIQASLE